MSEITSAVELWLPEADSRAQTLITHEVDQQAAQKNSLSQCLILLVCILSVSLSKRIVLIFTIARQIGLSGDNFCFILCNHIDL